MRCLDKFNRKMSLSGGSLRNENIRNARKLLDETFANDASFALGVYLWELGLDDYKDKKPVSIRIYKRMFSNANGATMKFQSMIDSPVIVGDVLYNSVKDEYYICTESNDIDSIHYQGELRLCNWILRWQNKHGDILEYPCHDLNTTQYNSGEQSNKLFTIGSSQHVIMLPCDENTVALSTPQRFFLDKNKEKPTSFMVTQNDTTSYNYGKKGLVKVTVLECELNSDTDRIDLGICDYIDKNNAKTDNAKDNFVSKSVISYETNIIKSGGDYQTFVGKFFDGYGNEIADIISNWDIICDFKDALYVEYFDNNIRIGIDNDEYIDEEFKLMHSDDNGNYSSSLIVKVESLL